MFRNSVANVMLAGLANGLLVSLPIGAVSMQAAYRWSKGLWVDALVMSSGVFLGDIIVALVVMVLVRRNIARVSPPFMIGGVAVMAWELYVFPDYQTYIETTDSLLACFLMGVVLTVTMAGNYGTYLLTYDWGVQYFFKVPKIVEMSWGRITLMISMSGIGLIIGWVLYFMAIEAWGMQAKAWFSWLTPRLIAVAVGVTLARLAFDYLLARFRRWKKAEA